MNAANQTVASFEAAYRQANALVSEANAAYFPTLGISASGTRSKSSAASFNTGNTNVSAPGRISNDYSTSRNASWELDSWAGADHGAEGMFILNDTAPPVGTSCMFTGDLTQAFTTQGTPAPAGTPYVLTPLIESRLTAVLGSESEHTIHLDGADIVLGGGRDR